MPTPHITVSIGPTLLPVAALAALAALGVTACWYHYTQAADGSGDGWVLLQFGAEGFDSFSLWHAEGSPVWQVARHPDRALHPSVAELRVGVEAYAGQRALVERLCALVESGRVS